MATASATRTVDDTDYTALTAEVIASATLCRVGIEEESLFDLRVGGQSGFALVPGDDEALLSGKSGSVPLAEDDATDQFILNQARARLCYGYPVMHYADGVARPLLIAPARLNGRIVEIDTSTPPRLNCGLLVEMGLTNGQAAALAHELADESMALADKLAKLASALQIASDRFNPSALEVVPDDGLYGRVQWHNRPIVAALTMPPARALVVKELAALSEAERAERVGDTALLALAEPMPQLTKDAGLPPLTAPMIWDMHRLGPSQTQACRSAMSAHLTGIMAPPGTGQMAMLVNLIATAVMNGESVLYAAAKPESARAMAAHLNGWIGRDVKAVPVVGHADLNQATQQDLIASLRELNRPKPEEEGEEEKPQKTNNREKPTLKSLQELDRLPSNTDGAVAPIRVLHEEIRERGEVERRMAQAMGAAWTGGNARAAAMPNASTMAEWQEQLDQAAGRKGGGLGGMMKSMLSKDSGVKELAADMRRGIAKLPDAVREEVLVHLEGADSAGDIEAAMTTIRRFGEWRKLVDKRLEAITRLVRQRDGRSIELQAMNQAARKISGVRELFRDFWLERLTEDPSVLESQIDTYFQLAAEREQVSDAKHRAHRSQRLAEAAAILSKNLPIWVTTVAEASDALPLEPGCFDLVIIDEADRVDFASALPLIYRGKRAAVVGASQHRHRETPLTAQRAQALQADHKTAPDWLDPISRSTIGNIEAMAAHKGSVPYLLVDHFRSHPAIADYLSSSFYDNQLIIRTNFRKLKGNFATGYQGMQWHDVQGRIADAGRGPINEAEVTAVLRLLKAWEDDGVFRIAPRPSIGIASPLMCELEQVREGIKRGDFADIVRERVTVATPGAFLGRQVDLFILLPGLAPGAPGTLNDDLAGSTATFHDAVGTAKVGVHVVGDRSACEAAGGYPAALAAAAGVAEVVEEVEEGYDDDFERRFDTAFGSEDEKDIDPWPALEDMLARNGYAVQRGVMVGGDRLALRVIAPLGGRYDIEIAKPVERIRNATELEHEIERDKRVTDAGYHVLRLTGAEVLGQADYVLQRLERLV